jgi:leucyl-tRNA synthetase
MTFSNLLIERWQQERWQSAEFQQALATLLVLLAPVAPYLAEELWQRGGRNGSVHAQHWPAYDPELAQETMQAIPVQVDGKVRSVLSVPAGSEPAQVEKLAREDASVQQALAGRQVDRFIHVTGKIVNIVSKQLNPAPGGVEKHD